MRTVWVLMAGALGVLVAPSLAPAQRALSTAVPGRDAPEPLLILRPEPELRALALEVAEVLELRNGEQVEVGEAPPPGLIEAVPAGHVALSVQGKSVVLVLGAAGGLSHDTSVRLARGGSGTVDARSVALAVEALRDLAVELARQEPAEAVGAAGATSGAEGPGVTGVTGITGMADVTGVPEQPEPEAPHEEGASGRRDGGVFPGEAGILGEVDPLVFARVYSGASNASTGPRLGVGAGLGLCVVEQCLFIAGDVPMQLGEPSALDARYEYTTFASGFYTRPFRFGDLAPGASVGFLTRVGRFAQDMGLGGDELQTDLGLRGTLELAYELLRGFDLMAEGGVDWTLDRLNVGRGEDVRRRVDSVSPWMQGVVRYRL